MSNTPTRLVAISGEEALYLLSGAPAGRLVYRWRQGTAVRPATHVLEYGRLVVRAPVPDTVLTGGDALAYHADAIDAASHTGWSVTVEGPVSAVTDPDEAAHHLRTLPGRPHGRHDLLFHLDPRSVHGHRLVPADPSARPRPARLP
ncbi:pyridoxamine 5'-phosphate oxidase family protein [Streptomyces megasporus]|uniref:pyridoxamine 5'-phosphate oxidase family protein n=1 Tax=Streptomyces megasporus TaxID=44060 RepID=UPI0005636EF0|nr:pyridoxamine 5'-phosphate oxidase family protein [Streptomyces megasporus]